MSEEGGEKKVEAERKGGKKEEGTIPKNMKKYAKTLTNWKVKKQAGGNPWLVQIEEWRIATKGQGASVGYGYSSGVKSRCAATYEQKLVEGHRAFCVFDPELEAWFIRSFSDEKVWYRLGWANAYRNPKYPHHKSIEEVNLRLGAPSRSK